MADILSVQVIFLVRDLLFSSRLVAAAKERGVTYRVVRDVGSLVDVAAPRLIVDLNQEQALQAAVAWKARHGGHVTGFISHVAADTIEQARRLGIDQILSNGAMTLQVRDLVRTA